MVERLLLAVPRGCLQFVIVVFPDHTHLLFFIQILTEHSASKQWRTWSDAAFRGVLSGFAQFADVPQKGRYAYMG